MKLKELEKFLNDYIEQSNEYHHKEEALKEFDKIHEKFTLDEIQHIGFIINDYPEYDHCLFKVSSSEFFFRVGFARSYLLSLSKKDIHKLAKCLYKLFGKIKIKE